MIVRNYLLSLLLSMAGFYSQGQVIEKFYFNSSDSSAGYYLAIRPQSGPIRGTLLVMTSFSPPEAVTPETKLHNVACVQGLLTVYVSMGRMLYADSAAIARLNAVVSDLRSRWGIDLSRVVLAGYENAGTIALRYTELANTLPNTCLMHPAAVFGVDSPVDLKTLWKWCEGQIRKNFYAGAVGDAHALMDIMTAEHGKLADNTRVYEGLSPFASDKDVPGNEQYLAKTPVRLYFDTDIQWRLANRRNSLYDTDIPDATEMIKRLMLLGNENAAFVSAKTPGMRSNGVRHPSSLSIVDEVDCIQWVKQSLDIFDPVTWRAPYRLPVPGGWTTEHFALPPDFAAGCSFKGVEDIRFHPGWGDVTSEGYWTYLYCWWMNAETVVDERTLAANLTLYYDGLVRQNIAPRHIPAEKIFPVVVSVKENGAGRWIATIRMPDYMTQKPMVLHGVIRIREGVSGKKAVLVEVSPQPAGHAVWTKMDAIVNGFEL